MTLFSHAKRIQPAQHLLPGQVPTVNYPDATPLDRPTRHSWKHAPLIIMAALAAVAVSGFVGWQTYEALVLGPEKELQRTIDALEADVDYNFPDLLTLIAMGDADMHQFIIDADNELVILEAYPENPEESEGFDLYRVPPTMNQKTASTYLKEGISSLKRSQASLFLNGSWRYTVYRYLACAVRLQYADFSVTNAGDAIMHAMELQGWTNDEVRKTVAKNFPDALFGTPTGTAEAANDDTVLVDEETEVAEQDPSAEDAEATEASTDFAGEIIMGEFGEDANGNTFQAGTLIIDGEHYEFRISTVTVEDMYGLGLPRDGMFVGVRLTQIILK